MSMFNKIAGFRDATDAGMTGFSLFMFVGMAMIGGYAVDVSNVMSDRTLLQNTADAAAHAAILGREYKTEAAAKADALAVAENIMPENTFGTILDVSSIVFGAWDAESGTFTPQPGSREAVRVTVKQTATNGNEIGTYLLPLVGFDFWELELSSTYTAYLPTCFREGFVAQLPVDIQSNNAFYNGFCIHSNEYVSLNSNNYFEPGTVVSMPDLADLDIPNSGFQTNTGLREALRSGSYHIRILQQISSIIDGVDEPSSRYYPDYITSGSIQTLSGNRIGASDLRSGQVHYWNCGARGTIVSGTVVSNMVIVANCEVTFAADVIVENAVIVNTSQSANSFSSPAGFQLGRNDNCAPGGGAQLVTMGGMNFAANLRVYGSQLLARGNIQFAANADGVQGAAMVAGGTLSGTSNVSMGHCETGMDDNFQSSYFRLTN